MVIDRQRYPQIDPALYADFPKVVEFEGKSFYATGKVGTHFKTGQPSAEYAPSDDRVWRRKDGTVERD